MRSTEGLYLDRIDHLRALAVTLVVFSHFLHGGGESQLLPTRYVPPDLLFPLSLFEEGQCGVSLFMVLSGYLFTRIMDGRDVVYSAFLANRALRLLPLLVVVMLPYVLRGDVTTTSVLMGFLRDGWQADGSWSIAIEIQFYLVLPLLLAAPARWRTGLCLGLLLAASAVRIGLHASGADVRYWTYYSLVGRADNFLVGMLLARWEPALRQRPGTHLVAAAAALLFAAIYHGFNRQGGMETDARSAVWILLPLVESLGFAALTLWYCDPQIRVPRRIGGIFAAIGEASYSIYLLHFTMIVAFLQILRGFELPAISPWQTVVLFPPFYALCVTISIASYRGLEVPFLRLRRPYLKARPTADRSSLAGEARPL